jgi:hypothetical protein
MNCNSGNLALYFPLMYQIESTLNSMITPPLPPEIRHFRVFRISPPTSPRCFFSLFCLHAPPNFLFFIFILRHFKFKLLFHVTNFIILNTLQNRKLPLEMSASPLAHPYYFCKPSYSPLFFIRKRLDWSAMADLRQWMNYLAVL